jgi:hypothetical protein
MKGNGTIRVCSSCRLERFLDLSGVEQLEGDIQCLSEAPVGVVADLACVHHGTDSLVFTG